VRDVFEAILYRSYLPGAVALPRPVASYPISTAPSGPSYSNQVLNDYPSISPNGSRKRAFADRGDGEAQIGRELQYGGDPNGRTYKQPRRGNLGPAGYDTFGNFRGPRQTQGLPPQISPRAMQSYPNMPSIPNPPPGTLPIDPSNPMAALMAMQAMGFPGPGIPPYSNTGAPMDLSRLPGAGFPPARRAQRCRDYDTKGFCARGNSCKFEHGTDSIYVPPPPADGKHKVYENSPRIPQILNWEYC
jgi:RNA-binding protein 26